MYHTQRVCLSLNRLLGPRTSRPHAATRAKSSGATNIRAARSMQTGRTSSQRKKVTCFYAGIFDSGLYNPTPMSGVESQHESPTVDPASVVPDEPQLHDLVPFVAGDRVFAVFAG